MADLVVLIWFTMNIMDPTKIYGPDISERTFQNHDECALFVNIIAKQPIVNDKYEFAFGTPDGTLFRGGCYNAEEYEKIFRKRDST